MTPTSTARGLFGSAIGILWLILATNAGIVLVSAWLMPPANGFVMFCAWLLTVVIVLVAAIRAHRRLANPKLIAVPIAAYILYSLVYGVLGGHLPRLLRVRETPLIPVDQADRFAGYDVYHFADGAVDLSRSASHGVHVATSRSDHGTIYFHVAPVVAAGWTAADPITAWVAADSQSEFPPHSWRQDLRGGYATNGDPNFPELIAKQVAAHHLLASAAAPIIVWSEHPREELLTKIHWELWLLVACDVAVFLSLLIPEFLASDVDWARLAARRASAPDAPSR